MAQDDFAVKLGDHAILNVNTGTFQPVESTVYTNVIQPKYYPETEPTKKLSFKYPGGAGWTLEAAANKVYQCLTSSALPPLDVQVYFLVRYFLTKAYVASESFKVGVFEVVKDRPVSPDLFVSFEMSETQESLDGGIPVGSITYEGLAAWLLIQARLGKNSQEEIRREYYTKIIAGLKDISSSPPFNIPHSELIKFPNSPTSFALTSGNPKIMYMASLFDYFSLVSSNPIDLAIRYSTLTTRFHDHVSLSLLSSLISSQLLPPDRIIKTFITKGLADDGLRILKPGQGVGKRYSLTPYSRSMELINKSCYSLTANPHFSSFVSILVACAGIPNQTLITHTGVSIDLEVTVAAKIFNYVLSAAPVGSYVISGSGRIASEPEKEKLGITTFKDFDEMIERVIREVKSQDGKPSADELEMLKKKLEKVPVRNSSLCEYIRHMVPYVPPAIELELDDQLSDLGSRP